MSVCKRIVSSEYTQMLLALVTFLAAMTAILSYLGINPGESGSINVSDSIILNSDGTVAEIWREAEIYNTFADRGNYYVIGYDKKLRVISPDEFAVINNQTLTTDQQINGATHPHLVVGEEAPATTSI